MTTASEYLSHFDLTTINETIRYGNWLMGESNEPMTDMDQVLKFHNHRSHICKVCGAAWQSPTGQKARSRKVKKS